jgi:hypothetical protein
MRGFDPRVSATAWLIGDGLDALDENRRQRVMKAWSSYRDHGPRLVGDGGCDVRIGGGGVSRAERAALLEWLPLTERELAVYEGGLFEDAPAHAIALLLRPPTIWGLDEAVEAEQLFPRHGSFAPARFAAIERHAYERIGAEHMTRLRRAVARIVAQLPIAPFPVASATVFSGCALSAADDVRGRAVVARQLARYASSALVGTCVREPGG